MSSQRVALIVVIVLAVVAVAWYRMQVFSPQEAAGPAPNIVVVTGGSNEFWQLVGNGAKAAAADLNVNLELLMPEKDEDINRQIQLIASIDLKKVDGVALSPLNAEDQSSLINRMAEKAFVVTMDSDAPQSARSSYIGTSNLAAGRTCANLVKEVLPEGGKVAVLLANLTKQNMIERKQGFYEAITLSDGPSYEVVDYLVDEGSPEKCVELLRNAIEANPDLSCLVGMNAYQGSCILKVLEETGKLDEIQVVAFDEAEDTLAGVEAGHIFATVVQDPYQYGYQSVRILDEFSRFEEAQRPMPGSVSTLSISTRTLRKDDVAKFRDNLQSQLK